MSDRWRFVALAVCIAFVLGDVVFTFLQHHAAPLDGDLPEAVLPLPHIEPVLSDPLALSVVLGGESYPNPNRFFAQWPLYAYFNYAPRLLQAFVTPLDSAYLAAAFAKTAMQVALLGMLATLAAGGFRWRRLSFWGSAALVTPLFQTNGYRSGMGIVDWAPTYAFNYAWPAVLLLAYAMPGLLAWRRREALRLDRRFCWAWPLLAVPVCLSGPLNAGVIGVGLALYGALVLYRGEALRLQATHYVYLGPLGLLAAYSLYVGAANSFTTGQAIPLAERYARLPVGIYETLTGRLGFLLVFGALAINYAVLLRNRPSGAVQRAATAGKWLAAFAGLYLLLLPLGGYRPARPNILRYDTMLPVTLGLMWVYAWTSVLVVRLCLRDALDSPKRVLRWYIPMLLAVTIALTNADRLEPERNAGQRAMVATLQAAPAGDTVVLETDATLLRWTPATEPNDSRAGVALLRRWGVLEGEVYYVQASGR